MSSRNDINFLSSRYIHQTPIVLHVEIKLLSATLVKGVRPTHTRRSLSTSESNVREDTGMFDWMLPEKHAIAILKKDHDTVKGFFDEFEEAESPAAKEKIIDQAVTALKIHA